MNAFSMDYLSSNLNHIYSLIKKNLSTTSNYLSAFVKENLSPILNDQQQRIALIATGIFASLVASYALYRCCCRKKQVVPLKVVQDSDVAVSSTNNDGEKVKKKKKKTSVKKESVISVATVAVNQLGVSGEKAPDNQANSRSAIPDTAAEIDNEPVEAAPANDNASDNEEGKEEKASSPPNSPIRRPKIGKGSTSQVSTQTTPSITIARPNWTEREFNVNGSSSISTGHAQVTFENGRGSLRFNGKVIEDNGTVASLTYDQRESGQKNDYTLDHPTYGLYQGTLENEILTGTRTCKNGAVQTGKFTRSESGEYLLNDPNGKIVHTYIKNGKEIKDEMTGHFVKGHFNKGERITTETSSEGSVVTRMEGTFLKFALHGPDGMITHSNGNVYQGTFENNRLRGSDGYNYKIINGHGLFEGDFVENRLNGKGRKTLPNGDTFKGKFINDQLTDLNGKKILANGDIIEGHFVQDRLNGSGKKTLVNGDILEGSFKGDQLNGSGTKTLVNGDVFRGIFVLGKLNGPIVITRLDANGERSEETIIYKDDEPVKNNEPIAVSFSSSSSSHVEEKKQAPQASSTEARAFGGAPAKINPKAAISFPSRGSTSATSSTIAPATGPLRFPSLKNVNAPEQQAQ